MERQEAVFLKLLRFQSSAPPLSWASGGMASQQIPTPSHFVAHSPAQSLTWLKAQPGQRKVLEEVPPTSRGSLSPARGLCWCPSSGPPSPEGASLSADGPGTGIK